MRYQVAEIAVPRTEHPGSGRFLDLPGRIVSVLVDSGGRRDRIITVLVELEES